MKSAQILTELNAEVFQYWIPRLVADGVDPNDIEAVRTQVKLWEEWPKAWGERGDAHRAWAEECLAAGHRITAGEALVRATLCYHFGQIIAFDDPNGKAAMQRRKTEAFREASPLLRPAAECIEVPWRNLTLPGYLRLPETAKPAPCVVLVPGLDATKEDFHTFAEMCLRRGIGIFAFDGPGQGEMRARSPLGEGFETSIVAVIDYLALRPEIDPRRIAILGRSLGGHYVLRAAAIDTRVAATVVFGGLYDYSYWDSMPPLVREGFRQALGAATEKEAYALIGGNTLDGCLKNVHCPVLVVHGKLDRIIPWKQAVRMVDEMPGRAALMLDEDGVHCCHNHAIRYRPAMADWLATALRAA